MNDDKNEKNNMNGKSSNEKNSDEKSLKEKILLEGIKAFAESGYHGASTNALAEVSGVSKGLIFHHYGNKKNLYLTCARYAFEFFEQGMRESAARYSTELVDRMIDHMRFKMDIYFKDPPLSKFLIRFYLDVLSESFPEAEEIFKEFTVTTTALLFENVSTEGYRSDFPPERLRDYVMTVVEAYSNRFLAAHKNNYIEAADHIEELIETMRGVKTLVKSGIYAPPDTGVSYNK